MMGAAQECILLKAIKKSGKYGELIRIFGMAIELNFAYESAQEFADFSQNSSYFLRGSQGILDNNRR
ncbi:MAG: hypothetical protein MUF72_10185 [Elainella sp. Prado103]|jgi:hypothetical protein|nr:hypothetical protein [Elainella sp. Prado103]